MPNKFLCGGGGIDLDLTEWFVSEEGPKGPGEFQCSETYSPSGLHRECVFTGIILFKLIFRVQYGSINF
jgi:hypothetical protein